MLSPRLSLESSSVESLHVCEFVHAARKCLCIRRNRSEKYLRGLLTTIDIFVQLEAEIRQLRQTRCIIDRPGNETKGIGKLCKEV